jgi:hypothetical protein
MTITPFWQDIATAPKDGTFVMLRNPAWRIDVESFWHAGSQAWSANVKITDLENLVVGPEPPTQWKPLTPEQAKY